MSAQNYGQIRESKNRDQIGWQRDRTRIQTEARLFMAEVMDTALYELAMERKAHPEAQIGDQQYLIIKHVVAQLCAPERREVVEDAVQAVLTERRDAQAIPRGFCEVTEVGSASELAATEDE